MLLLRAYFCWIEIAKPWAPVGAKNTWPTRDYLRRNLFLFADKFHPGWARRPARHRGPSPGPPGADADQGPGPAAQTASRPPAASHYALLRGQKGNNTCTWLSSALTGGCADHHMYSHGWFTVCQCAEFCVGPGSQAQCENYHEPRWELLCHN